VLKSCSPVVLTWCEVHDCVFCRASYSNSVFHLAANSLAHDKYRLKHVRTAQWCLQQRKTVTTIMTMLLVMLRMQVAVNAGIYEILDNLDFTEFEAEPSELKTRRARWTARRAGSGSALPPRGQFTWSPWQTRRYLTQRTAMHRNIAATYTHLITASRRHASCRLTGT